MAKFRLGLVGAGRMGQTHLRAIALSDLVEVVSIAEPSPANRGMLTSSKAKVFADTESMLKSGGLDGVLVAVPSPFHVPTVEQIASAGLPILCEKPCGITAAHAAQAASIVAKKSVLLQIAYWRRFVPSLKALRDRIMAGDLGDLYFVACWQWDQTPPATSFRKSGGGIFIDMGVHEFDQMRWLTGQDFVNFRVSSAQAVYADAVPGDPDAVQALCDLSGGASGLISLGRRYAPGDSCWAQAFGTKASEECRFLSPSEGEVAFIAGLKLQAESFALAVNGKPCEGATVQDAIAALQAAELATKQLTVMKPKS